MGRAPILLKRGWGRNGFPLRSAAGTGRDEVTGGEVGGPPSARAGAMREVHRERKAMSSEPVGLQAVQKRDLHLEVEAWAAQNMRKEARVTIVEPAKGATYDIACDEGFWLGGDDTAPPPLAYFSSSIAF